MADRPIPKNFGVPRPIPQKYLPTQAKISRDYIQMAGSEQELKRRRANAQQAIITQTYATVGIDAASYLGNLVKAYPNMSAGSLIGLTKGIKWLPPDQRKLPVDQQRWVLPVADDPAASLARNDAEASIADGSYNAPAAEPAPPRNLWQLAMSAFDAPQGIKDIPVSITNALKAATSGSLAGLGWSAQVMTNAPRQYYGSIDHALYVQSKYDLSDEEMQALYADQPDVLDAVLGNPNLRNTAVDSILPNLADNAGNPMMAAVGLGLDAASSVMERFTGLDVPDAPMPEGIFSSTWNQAETIARDPGRRNGPKFEGDPNQRLDQARFEIDAHRSDLQDMYWNNTALGQWWMNVGEKVDPQWVPSREYQQAEQNMIVGVSGDQGAMAFLPGPGAFDLRSDADKARDAKLAIEYQQKRIARGLQVSEDKMLGYMIPHEWTIGRGFMWNIDDDPDSAAQRIGAGIIDFASAILLDPANFVPVGKIARGVGTAAAARKAGTVSEAVVAARKATTDPKIREMLIPDDVSDEVVAQFAGNGQVTAEALDASRLQVQADQALSDATSYLDTVEPQLVFNERGVGSLVDQEGRVLVDSGVRRTVTGQGAALTYPSKSRARTVGGQADTTVTLETRPIVAKDGSIDGYGLYRTVQQADGSTKTTRSKGTYATVEEADEAAVQRYVSDSEQLHEPLKQARANVRAAQAGEKAATSRLQKSAKQLRQLYRDHLALRTQRLSVSGEKDSGWFVHDASETPYTNLRIARVEVDDTPLYTAEGYKVVHGRDRIAVRKGRSTEAVFDTVEEAQQYLLGKVDESLPEAVDDVPATKLTREGDGWVARSGHQVSKTGKGRYSVYEPRGDQMVRVGTFDSHSAAQAAVRRSYGKMRGAAQKSMTLTEQPRRKMVYGILDGDELVSTHARFSDATKDILGRARTRQEEDIARLDGTIENVKSQREALRTGKAEAELTRTRSQADIDRMENPDITPSQFDEVVAAGDDIVTDPEQALLERWWSDESANLDDLVQAADMAKQKKAMSKFVTNEKMWRVLTETVAGQELVDWLVKQPSADAILRRIPALKADHAAALGRAENTNEVLMILSNLIGPQYDFRDLSKFGMLSNARVKAVDAIANTDRLNTFYRLSQLAPHGNMVDGDNLDDVYWQVRRFSEGLGAKPDEVAPYLDNLLMNTRNKTERYELIYGRHGLIEGLLKRLLREQKVPEGEIHKILSAFAGGTDIAQRRRLGISKSSELVNLPAEQQVLDGLLKGTDPVPVTGRTQEEALLAHMLLSGKVLMLPDYRNVRKTVNMFAKAERYARRNAGNNPEAQAKFSRMLSDASNSVISGWRNAVLISGARAVRDLSDLQIRFGGAGGPSILTSPYAFFANAMSATVARESQSKFRAFMKSAPLLFVPSVVKHMRRNAPGYDEQRYRGSFLVDARGLQRLLTDDIPDDMNGATRWQSRAQIDRGETPIEFGSDKDFLADISRRGVAEPIVIVYDRAKDGYRIADGAKRAHAAYRMRSLAVPVKIVAGTIEDGQSFVKARTAKSKQWGRWSNINGNDGYYLGGVRQVIDQGRAAARQSLTYSIGLRALIPAADQEWARANGEGFFDDYNAVMNGEASQDILSDLSNQSTTFMGNFSVDQHLSSGRGITLSTFGKEEPAMREDYAMTWADRAGELRTLPHIGDLLNGRKSLDDVVEEIMSNPAQRDEYLAMINARGLSKQKAANSDELLNLLREENDQLDQYIRGQYQMTLDAIADLTGGGNHVDLFKAVVDGKFEGKAINRTNGPLVSYVQKLLSGDGSPDYVDPYLPDRLQGVSEDLLRKSSSFVDRVFDAHGEVMDVFGMVGPQRDKYREHVVDLARYLSDDDREQMAKIIAGRGDDKLAKDVRRVGSVDANNSMFDPDMVDKIAMRRATADIKEVFYDAHQRRNWALALRVVTPFAQAAVNTVYTWGKLMMRNPENAYRTYKPVQALMEPESDVLSDLLDFNVHEDDPYSLGRGFFTEDPTSGMRTFNYPIVNALAGKIINGLTGGADTQFDLQANAQSLNSWQSGIAGGVSPVVTVPLGVFDPEASLRDNLFGQFLRFQGVTPSTGDDPVQAAVEQFVPLKVMDLFASGERKKAELIAANYAAEAASGRWDMAQPGDRNRALSAAETKANAQMFAEGILEVFAPTFGSMNTQVRIPLGGKFPTDESGRIVVRQAAGSIVYDEARSALYDYIKNPDGTFKEGDELKAAKTAYYEDYGIGPLLAARAMIMDKESLPRSSEAYDLYEANPEWFKYHSDVVRYLFSGDDVFGANVEGSVYRLATYYERRNGARYLSGEDMSKIVQKEFAETWSATAGQRAAERNGGTLSPYSDTAIREEARKFGGEWTLPNQPSTADTMRKIDDSLRALPAEDLKLIPGGDKIVSYMQERERWEKPGSSYALYALGRRYVGEDKSGGFSSFWFRVAGDEFSEAVKATSSWMD